MARIRNIVMEGATGRLGSMVLTQRAGTGTVARTLAPEVTNPKSDAQQTRRVKWANLVNFYKVSKGWMAKAFENKASNQSDYNKFMSLNANTTQVALTKDQANQGGVIAGPYTISQGSLPSVEITKLSSGSYATSLAIGDLVISTATTVGELSQALLANNGNLRAGMQISFISYQQQTNGVTGVPYVICGWYEITIDTEDTRLVDSVMPVSFAAASVENDGKYLGTGPDLSAGSFAYVLSQRQGGKIMTSTQQLTVHNNMAYNAAITQAALEAAIDSYGRGNEVFLAPGYAGGGQSQSGVSSIISAQIGDKIFIPGITVMTNGDMSKNQAELYLNFNNLLSGVTVSSVTTVSDTRRTASDLSISGSTILAKQWTPAWYTGNAGEHITSIEVVLSDGKNYTVSFPAATVVE